MARAKAKARERRLVNVVPVALGVWSSGPGLGHFSHEIRETYFEELNA